MRILVAGGAGMIGSNLCRELLQRGDRVVCVDNLATGALGNLALLRDHPRFSLVLHDIVEGAPALPKVDRIYHLASPASPRHYARMALETLRANSEGTRFLLELARDRGARFLYASTSEVYGDPERHPQSESYRGNVSSIGPRSMYDEAKRYGEAIVMTFVRVHGLDARVVRIFNTYGPCCDPNDGRLVTNLITQALRGDAMTIYGSGRQTRSLCYVSDMVEGLIRAMDRPGLKGEVLNLGNPDEHTILEYASLIRKLAGSSSGMVRRQPEVGDDPACRRPDIRKAMRLLHWRPRVRLRDGLCRTIEYIKGVLPAGERPEPVVRSPSERLARTIRVTSP